MASTTRFGVVPSCYVHGNNSSSSASDPPTSVQHHTPLLPVTSAYPPGSAVSWTQPPSTSPGSDGAVVTRSVSPSLNGGGIPTFLPQLRTSPQRPPATRRVVAGPAAAGVYAPQRSALWPTREIGSSSGSVTPPLSLTTTPQQPLSVAVGIIGVDHHHQPPRTQMLTSWGDGAASGLPAFVPTEDLLQTPPWSVPARGPISPAAHGVPRHPPTTDEQLGGRDERSITTGGSHMMPHVALPPAAAPHGHRPHARQDDALHRGAVAVASSSLQLGPPPQWFSDWAQVGPFESGNFHKQTTSGMSSTTTLPTTTTVDGSPSASNVQLKDAIAAAIGGGLDASLRSLDRHTSSLDHPLSSSLLPLSSSLLPLSSSSQTYDSASSVANYLKNGGSMRAAADETRKGDDHPHPPGSVVAPATEASVIAKPARRPMSQTRILPANMSSYFDRAVPNVRRSAVAEMVTDEAGMQCLNDRYVLTDQEIGRGSEGTVVQVVELESDTTFAMKVIPRPPTRNQAAFIAELRIARTLVHPRIVKVHEIIDDPTSANIFLVMVFIEGKPLVQLDSRTHCCTPCPGTRPLDASALLDCTFQLCHALRYVHRKGICHRDIKPSNVLVHSVTGRAYLLDFGQSVIEAPEEQQPNVADVGPSDDPAVSDRQRQFSVANVLSSSALSLASGPSSLSSASHRSLASSRRVGGGTLAFLAPEILLGGIHNAASDMWSLGVSLYAARFMTLPFRLRDERGCPLPYTAMKAAIGAYDAACDPRLAAACSSADEFNAPGVHDREGLPFCDTMRSLTADSLDAATEHANGSGSSGTTEAGYITSPSSSSAASPEDAHLRHLLSGMLHRHPASRCSSKFARDVIARRFPALAHLPPLQGAE